MNSSPDREIAGEVTRVEAVKYLRGATGHGLGSLGLLGVGVVGMWATGRPEFGFGALVAAWLVTMNGLSLFAWDWIRDYVHSVMPQPEESGPERTIATPSMSSEQKAEMVAGFAQILVLIGIIFVSIEIFLLFGTRTGSYVLGGALAIGNASALLVAGWPSASDG